MTQNLFVQINSPEWEEAMSIVRAETRMAVTKELDDERVIWLSTQEAMAYMKVDSPTTLAKYRDERNSPIVCSKPSKDTVYLKSSLNKYLLWKKK